MIKTIGFVVPSLKNGGAERVVATLGNFFSKNYGVVIVTLSDSEVFYELNSSIELVSVRNAKPSKSSIHALLGNYAVVKKIHKTIEDKGIDILISFTTSANVLAINAAKKSKIPCIISERNNAKVVPPNLVWRTLRNKFYKSADFLVVQTSGNKDFYSSIIESSKIKVIQNPVSEKFATLKRSSKADSDITTILTVGRLNSNKAHHIMLMALSKLQSLPWQLIVVGGGPLQNQLQTLSKDLKLDKRVNFTGSIKNVDDYYKHADLFVFTSRSEGFPNALMEAHSIGIPCISTNCDFGPADIITDNSDGFLIPVDDVEALIEKLQMLITNKDLRKKISEKALAQSSRFEMKRIAEIWNNLIQEALLN